MNDPPTAPSRAAADTRSLAAFAALALIWGYNWVVMKIALVYTGPIHFAYLRVGFGGLLLFALLVALRAPLAPRHVGKTALVGLCQTTGFVGLISLALVYGGVLALYGLVVAFFSGLLACRHGSLRMLPWLPLVFATIHASAGCGILHEAALGWRAGRRRKQARTADTLLPPAGWNAPRRAA